MLTTLLMTAGLQAAVHAPDAIAPNGILALHRQSAAQVPFSGPGELLGSTTLKHSGELLTTERIGDRYVTVTRGGEVGLWSVPEGEALGKFTLGDVATAWTLDAGGRLLVGLRSNGLVAIDASGEGGFETLLQAEGSLVAAGGPDGSSIAILSNLSPVKLWLEGAGEPQVWDLGRQVFTGAEFDAAGRLLVVMVDRDRLFKRGHAMDRPTTQLALLEPGVVEARTYSLFEDSRSDAFIALPDGTAVAADSGGKLTRLQLETGETLGTRQIGLTAVLGLRYSPATGSLWCISADGRLQELDPETLEERSTLELGAPLPRSWSLISGGTEHLISRNNRGEVLDAASGEVLLGASGHIAPAVMVDFDGAGQRLISASYDSSAILWDLGARRPLRKLDAHDGFVYSARFSPSGEAFATAGKDGTVHVYRAGVDEPQVLQGHRAAVTDLCWGIDDTELASVAGDAQVIGWNLEEGKERWIQELESGVLFRAALAGSELILAESSVATFDIGTGARRSPAKRYDAIVTATAGLQELAVLGLANGSLQILKRKDELLLRSASTAARTGRVEALAIDAGGVLIAAGLGSSVLFFSVEGELLGELGPLDGPVMSLAFSGDGQTLAAGTQTGSILTWDRAPGR